MIRKFVGVRYLAGVQQSVVVIVPFSSTVHNLSNWLTVARSSILVTLKMLVGQGIVAWAVAKSVKFNTPPFLMIERQYKKDVRQN